MLAVDEGFERFLGPSAIKPLNFNYDFQPTFVGQNIWTLTDNLFVSDYKRGQDETDDFMKCVYSKLKNVGRDAQKKSQRYKQFPSIDHDIHQKSSSAQGFARRLKIVGSPLSGSSGQESHKTPYKSTQVTKGKTIGKIAQLRENSFKKQASFQKFTPKKRHQQTSLTLKLSEQETEKLLKSLDFKVRTVKKAKPYRDRSRSEAAGRDKAQIRTARKRSSASKVEVRKTRPFENSEPKSTPLENQRLLKSSQMSSEKNSRMSGMNELVGPLPKINCWTPTHETIQQKRSSSDSSKKKPSERSGGSKTSTNSKKLTDTQSHDISREPSNENTSQKVKTTRVRIIPKITLNNQLLKSTTPKTEKLEKTMVKATTKKKDIKAKTDSILWTPEKIALLDQITNDQQLKAVLMSAGDTYMKSRKYFAVKSNLKSKPPVKQAWSTVKKEATDLKKVNNPGRVATVKTPSVAVTKKIKQDNDAPKLTEKAMTETQDANLAVPENTIEARTVLQPVQKGNPKPITSNVLLKTDGVPKTARPKKFQKKEINSQSLNDSTNKTRPKYGINSRQVKKVEERLAQLSAEVTGNSSKVQDKKVPQIQRANLDRLRKLIDKSLTKLKEDHKAGEIKSD